MFKKKNLNKTLHIFWFIFADLCTAVTAWILFFALRKNILGEEPVSLLDPELFLNAFIVGVFWVLVYAFSGFYADIYKKSRIREFLKTLSVNFIGVVVVFFVLLLDDEGVTSYTFYYKTFALYYAVHTFVSLVGKILVISRIKKLIKTRKLFFNTLMVGSNKNAINIFTEMENNYEVLGLRFIGYVQVFEQASDFLDKKIRNFGGYENLPKVIRRAGVEHIVIAIEPSEHKKIQEILNMMEGYNIKVSIIPDIYELLLGSVKVSQVFGVPLIEVNQDLIPVWQKTVKRGIDILVALSVLVIGFPFFLIVALLIKLTSRGPVFYVQERIGKDGVPFNIIKFRSMYVNAEKKGPALSSERDPRITSWGRIMRKVRLDEFPQLYNVLIGDMSLVGPRPEREYFIKQIIEIAPEYKHLQRVRPGITSLGQVKFGYAENVEEMVKRLKYDILYIENMSLAMDFRIILYTLLIMLQGRGK